MKKITLLVLLFSTLFSASGQQWGGPNDQTSVITRSGNVTVNSLYLGRYNGALVGDSNPFNLYHADGQRELILFGSSASTFHLRLYDGDIKLGDQQTPNSTLYNNGSLSLGGSVGDRLTIAGEGRLNLRLGRWATLGETGGGLATLLGSNVKASTGNDNVMEYITSTVDGARAIKLQYDQGISFHTFYGTTNAGGTFSGYERMRIANSGNVGIGTINPDSKLTVNGKIKAEEVEIVVDVPADYVFDENYDLKSLEEVERFVKQNKHLPGVPNAESLKANGWQVGEMNNKLLEKVEELTLYLIELKKENAEIKQELASLKSKQ